jgi:hypothetical protein
VGGDCGKVLQFAIHLKIEDMKNLAKASSGAKEVAAAAENSVC